MRVTPLVLAFALFACSDVAPSDVPVEVVHAGLNGAGTFEKVTSFGANPGALEMYRYVPSPAPSGAAPIVVALHACSQSATAYRAAGWEPLADQYGFYVIYPQQPSANNALNCFNWAGEYGNGANIPRGDGENQSIKSMVDKMKADYAIDGAKVFTTGHSGGGAESALLLATWPDVFSAGASIAGIPYLCTKVFSEVSGCLNPGRPRAASVWGGYVRDAYAAFSGKYPRMSVWHGTADSVVNKANATEMVKQWTDVHGADQTVDETLTVDGHTRKLYKNAQGEVVVEQYEITGAGHGTFVDPDKGCGSAGAYFLDNNICSSFRIAEFFGIVGGASPGDTAPPTVTITAPADQATVTGVVDVTLNPTDDTGVTSVEVSVNGTPIGTDNAPPWTVSWNAATLPSGTYTLTATAHDAAGNSGGDTVQVTVQSVIVDSTPPTVNLTAPATGSTVSGVVTLSADATDGTAIDRVEFLVNGAIVGEDDTAPFSAAWDTTSLAAGSYAVAAKAFDAAGNQATDNDTSVTVEEGVAPADPPVVTLLSPTDGATISGIAELDIGATSGTATISQVILFWKTAGSGEQPIGTDRAAPYSFIWDVRQVAEGPQTLIARAFDAAGGIGSVEFDVVVQHIDDPDDPDDPDPTGPRRAGRSYWGCSGGDALVWPLVFAALALLALRRRSA